VTTGGFIVGILRQSLQLVLSETAGKRGVRGVWLLIAEGVVCHGVRQELLKTPPKAAVDRPGDVIGAGPDAGVGVSDLLEQEFVRPLLLELDSLGEGLLVVQFGTRLLDGVEDGCAASVELLLQLFHLLCVAVVFVCGRHVGNLSRLSWCSAEGVVDG
jgi:hypothetical protein